MAKFTLKFESSDENNQEYQYTFTTDPRNIYDVLHNIDKFLNSIGYGYLNLISIIDDLDEDVFGDGDDGGPDDFMPPNRNGFN